MNKQIQTLVETTLKEDIGNGDLTADLIPVQAQAQAKLICRESAVLCGRPWFDAVFDTVDQNIAILWQVDEGAMMAPDQLVCEIKGNARSILTAERAAINLLQTLSGTASIAKEYADQLKGLDTKVLDTRKTLPGMRLAQKYAARIGGADNHRFGLYDGVLIKENHIRAVGSIKLAVEKALHITPDNTLLEVEVENLDELDQALKAGAKRILLDNFSPDQLRSAVADKPLDVKLEASGNVTLETIRDIALTGVDFISVGAITKHVKAVDFSLQFTLEL